MALNTFMVAIDFAGNNSLVAAAPEYVDSRVLAVASTNESHTVPTGADIVIFSATAEFWAKPNGTAAIPAADVTDGTGSQRNPTAWLLRDLSGGAITAVGLISATAGAVVNMAFYKLQKKAP